MSIAVHHFLLSIPTINSRTPETEEATTTEPPVTTTEAATSSEATTEPLPTEAGGPFSFRAGTFAVHGNEDYYSGLSTVTDFSFGGDASGDLFGQTDVQISLHYHFPEDFGVNQPIFQINGRLTTEMTGRWICITDWGCAQMNNISETDEGTEGGFTQFSWLDGSSAPIAPFGVQPFIAGHVYSIYISDTDLTGEGGFDYIAPGTTEDLTERESVTETVDSFVFTAGTLSFTEGADVGFSRYDGFSEGTEISGTLNGHTVWECDIYTLDDASLYLEIGDASPVLADQWDGRWITITGWGSVQLLAANASFFEGPDSTAHVSWNSFDQTDGMRLLVDGTTYTLSIGEGDTEPAT